MVEYSIVGLYLSHSLCQLQDRLLYLHPGRVGVSWKACLPPRRLVTRHNSFLGCALLRYLSLLLRACVEIDGRLGPVLPLLYSISGAQLCQGFFEAPRLVLRGASRQRGLN